ncbi:uncharacterized protein YALI1_C15532g [Yarrowia lipolytica]|uniref:Uncharacterized protein n=1 Tax=Yarrowia lipolytica TaxID=4952 RepID=A0A1D8NAN1_YARLL|nr:hypothetical protein YALI1_C15532g [Yarrowia lipolytica]
MCLFKPTWSRENKRVAPQPSKHPLACKLNTSRRAPDGDHDNKKDPKSSLFLSTHKHHQYESPCPPTPAQAPWMHRERARYLRLARVTGPHSRYQLFEGQPTPFSTRRLSTPT